MNRPTGRPRSQPITDTELYCYWCDELRPDEDFHRGSQPSRRFRAAICKACLPEYKKTLPVRACRSCGEPTRSYQARLCDACRPEHQSGVGLDLWVDRHGEPHWTHERIIALIRRWARQRKRPPAQHEWRKRDGEWPTAETVRDLFGTWNAAIAAAGLTPREPGKRRSFKGRKRCRNGHPWKPLLRSDGYEECSECAREKVRRYRARKKVKA